MKTIVDNAVQKGGFQKMLRAIIEAGLDKTLQSRGPFTVFMPTDEAFAKLPEGTFEALISNKRELTKMIANHLLSGVVTTEDVAEKNQILSMVGQKIKVDTTNGIKVNDAKIVGPDIMCSNGIIHVVDHVILPED